MNRNSNLEKRQVRGERQGVFVRTLPIVFGWWTFTMFACLISLSLGVQVAHAQNEEPKDNSGTPRQKLQDKPVPAVAKQMVNWLNAELERRGVNVDQNAMHLVVLVDTADPTSTQSVITLSFLDYLLGYYLVQSEKASDHFSLGYFQAELYRKDVWNQPFRPGVEWLNNYPTEPAPQGGTDGQALEGALVGGQDLEGALLTAVADQKPPEKAIYLLLSRRRASLPPSKAPRNYVLTKQNKDRMRSLNTLFPKVEPPKMFEVEMVNVETKKRTLGPLFAHLYVPARFTPLGKLSVAASTPVSNPRAYIQEVQRKKQPVVTTTPEEKPLANSSGTGPPRNDHGFPWLPVLVFVALVGGLGGYLYWLNQPVSIIVGPENGTIKYNQTQYIVREGEGVKLSDLPTGGLVARLTVTLVRGVRMSEEGRYRIRNAPVTLTQSDKNYTAQYMAGSSEAESEEIQFRAKVNA